MKLSLSARLLLNTAGALLCIVALALGGYAALVTWGADYLFNVELDGNMRRLAGALRFDAGGKLVAVALPRPQQVVFDALPQDAIYRVLSADGRVLLASDHVSRPLTAPGLPFLAGQDTFRTAPSGLALRVLMQPVRQGAHLYYLQMARSERFQRKLRDNNTQTSWIVALAVGLVAMLAFSVVVWLTFRRSLRPLRDASRAAARIAPDNLAARLDTAAMPAELMPLLQAFNAALARLERGYQVQREFLATAAHELKTPLTLMRGQLELDGVADPALLLQDVDRMSRQVQQLLNLAECSEPHNYQFETVDVLDAVTDATQHLRRLAAQRGVAIDIVCGAAPGALRADRGALFVLLKNLLENALQHCRAGAGVCVIVVDGQLVVRDQGSGIAAADLPRLFERFWRGAHRRDDGAGLGLAICREIAHAHGWTLGARNAAVGAEFVLDWPARPAA